MKNIKGRLAGILWFLFVLTLLTAMWVASFLLTGFLYTAANLHPSAMVVQVVNSALGLILTGLLIGFVSRAANSAGWIPQMQVFSPIIEALEKIATGDFSIRLDNEIKDHRIVGELASSVNRMAAELDQMENMRQEFISNVSHEIQSPLTSIRGFAQALEDDGLSSQARHHYLGIIEVESTRLSRITEDLLRLAALESDQARFEPKPFRLDQQIRSLILACEPQWVEKGLEMDVELVELDIRADEDLLSQVWTNLIHNSIKFTPSGGKINIQLRRQGSSVQFCISDTGIGIGEEDRAHIFERFYKADKSRTRSNGGSGLGLAIARKIVEIHRGTIALEGGGDKGSTFTVTLPVA